MATHDYIISNASGAAVRADLNNALAAIATNNSSATEPTTTYAYQWWADTGSSPTVMKLRNAANSGWITLFQLDGEWTVVPFENGTAAAPSIYFKDSGTDTGIYSPGTDQVGISAGGTSRFEVSTSATTSTLPVVHPLGAVGTPSITFTGDLNTGIWSPAADTVAVSTNGTRAITIDSSQRLGIGTTSPAARLEVSTGAGTEARIASTVDNNADLTFYTNGVQRGIVEGNSVGMLMGTTGALPTTFITNNTERARIDSSGRWLLGTSSAIAALEPSIQTARSSGAFLALGRDDTSITDDELLGAIYFYGNQGSSWSNSARIEAKADAAWGTNDYPSKLVFSTTADGASSPTERMRIRQNGNIGIGVTGYDTVRLAINGQSTTSSDYALAVYNSSSGDLFVVRNDGYINTGTRAVSPYNNTTASAANVNVFSDGGLYRSTSSIRYKTDVETVEDQYSDALLGCRPVWYKSLCAGDNKEWGYWGFIAEEVAQIDPRLCFFKEEEDGTLEPEGVQYDRFVPHLLNLIKRQKEQIEAMEARLTALESA